MEVLKNKFLGNKNFFRNTNTKINIDICRFIAALMIVAIHIYPFSSFSEDIDYIITRVIFRIAVPLFLMITGYYILPKALPNKEVIKTYSNKIIKLYVISIIIYIPINIYNGYFYEFNIFSFLKDLFINGTFYHLWYFPALMLGLWITYYLLKKVNLKIVGIIVIILYIIGIFGDNYFGIIKNTDILNTIYKTLFYLFDYTRNGLFYTPIFLYIGYLIYKKKFTINNKHNLLLISLNLLFLIIEGILLYLYKIPKHNSMYFSLIPLSFLLFNFIINNIGSSNKELRNISSWLYILHPLFIAITHFISKLLQINLLNNSLVNYIIVLILTLGLIFFMKKFKEVVKNKKLAN